MLFAELIDWFQNLRKITAADGCIVQRSAKEKELMSLICRECIYISGNGISDIMSVTICWHIMQEL